MVEKKKEPVSEETMTSHIQDMVDREEWSKVLKVCAGSKFKVNLIDFISRTSKECKVAFLQRT